MEYKTPILLLIFNRPENTAKVFSKIREARPSKLFIAADGPRENNESDEKKCSQVRDEVMNGIDWNCEVKTLFRETNLGCGKAVSEAITWFFDHVEEGVILEDDTVPDSTFFYFCDELLNYYRNDFKVMHISGSNFQSGNKRTMYTYYFSIYPHCWGWATWKRAWEKFNFECNSGEFLKVANEVANSNKEAEYWYNIFTNTYINKRFDIWDYRWVYNVWKNKGVCVLPNVNLVENIGIGNDATHTSNLNINTKVGERILNIDHPPSMVVNIEADKYTFKNHFVVKQSSYQRIKKLIHLIISKIIT